MATEGFEEYHELLNQNLSLPNYMPLHFELNRDFEKVSNFRVGVFNSINEQIDQITKEAEDYIQFFLKENEANLNEDLLNEYLSSMEKLVESKLMLDEYKQSLENSAKEIKESSISVPELTLETLEECRSARGINFAEFAIQEYKDIKESRNLVQSIESAVQANESYRYLKNIAFIVQHPQDPLPDEVEDDDILISGGKISLKDPLSLNYFETPLISNKCNHTFEKSSIYDYLDNKTNCPINGCSENLTRASLKLDKLMLLRVKTYIALEKKGKKIDENVERLL